MIEVGRHCVKIAGRDAGKHCLIIDIIDTKTVLIDGETRKRKCNVRHLEPLENLAKLKKNASHDQVLTVLKGFGVSIKEKKPVPRKPKEAPAQKGKKGKKKKK